MPSVDVRAPRCPHVVPGRGVLLVDAIGRLSATPRGALAELSCPDVHRMARLLAGVEVIARRAEFLARTDRMLSGAPSEPVPVVHRGPDRFTLLAAVAAVTATAAVFGVAFLIGTLL